MFVVYAVLLQFCIFVYAANNERPIQSKTEAKEGKRYAPGDRILVECLNRTVYVGKSHGKWLKGGQRLRANVVIHIAIQESM